MTTLPENGLIKIRNYSTLWTQELNLARDRLANLYDDAPVGYLTLERKGRIIHANITAARLLGVPRPVLTANRLYDYIAPEDQDTYFEHRRAMLIGGTPQGCDARIVSEDGHRFEARLESTPELDERGEMTSYRTAIIDLSRQGHVSKWPMPDALLEAVNEGVAALDAGGRVTRANPAFLTLTGYAWEAMNGRPADSFLLQEDSDETLDAIWAALEIRGRWTSTLRCKRRNGEIFVAKLLFVATRPGQCRPMDVAMTLAHASGD